MFAVPFPVAVVGGMITMFAGVYAVLWALAWLEGRWGR